MTKAEQAGAGGAAKVSGCDCSSAAAAQPAQRHKSSIALADYYLTARRYTEATPVLTVAANDGAQGVAAKELGDRFFAEAGSKQGVGEKGQAGGVTKIARGDDEALRRERDALQTRRDGARRYAAQGRARANREGVQEGRVRRPL